MLDFFTKNSEVHSRSFLFKVIYFKHIHQLGSVFFFFLEDHLKQQEPREHGLSGIVQQSIYNVDAVFYDESNSR